MESSAIALVSIVAMAAAAVGVITGGNSLVTVPVLLSLGMEPRRAVATNMLAITFLSLAGGARFVRGSGARFRWDLTLPLCALTLVSSWLGARLLVVLPEGAVRGIVAGAMLIMVAVLVARPRFGEAARGDLSPRRRALGYLVATLLGVYGGLFSGGYTTLLTFAVIGLLGASLVEAVGVTKLVNFVSSGIAALEFARQGLVDYSVGLPMAAAMALGAWLGAQLAVRRGFGWVRLVFVVAVALLAVKLLIVDLLPRAVR